MGICATGSDRSVRRDVISVRDSERRETSSLLIDRLISMMGEKKRILLFFSLRLDGAEVRRGCFPSKPFLDHFRKKTKKQNEKNLAIAKDEKNEQKRYVRFFLLTYFHLAFGEIFMNTYIYIKNEIETIDGCPMYRRPQKHSRNTCYFRLSYLSHSKKDAVELS